MCLDSITEKYSRPQREVARAYKVFQQNDRKLYALYYHKHIAFPLDTWLKAEKQEIKDTTSYTSGFHAYEKELKDIRLTYTDIYSVQKPVYLYGIRIKGLQGWNDFPTLVADWLYIPSDPTAPPPAAPARARRKDKLDATA